MCQYGGDIYYFITDDFINQMLFNWSLRVKEMKKCCEYKPLCFNDDKTSLLQVGIYLFINMFSVPVISSSVNFLSIGFFILHCYNEI